MMYRVQLSFMVAFMTVALLSACGSDDNGATDSGPATPAGLGKKLPGPCQIDLVTETDKVFEKHTLFTWDAEGRPLTESSGQGTISVSDEFYKKEWQWDEKGQLVREFFETNGADPNIDFTYTYDAEGRPVTRKGTHSTNGTEDCVYEYQSGSKDYNLLCNTTTTEDVTDDNGNIIDTNVYKSSYTIEYIFGINQQTELLTYAGSTAPEQTTHLYNDKGQTIAIELDPFLSGEATYVTLFTYDKNDALASKSVDSDADGTPEMVTTYENDDYGNAKKSSVEVKGLGKTRSFVYHYDCF